VHATYERLLLRVAVDDPVAIAYKETRDRLTALADVFASHSGGPDEDAAIVAFKQARATYLEQARLCLQSKGPAQ
jgi:hypothetical protein